MMNTVSEPAVPVVRDRLLRAALLPLEPGLAAANCWAREHDASGRPGSALLVYQKPAATAV